MCIRKEILISVAIALLWAAPAPAASRRTPVVEAVEHCSPAVVNISSERVIRQQYDPSFGYRDRMFDELFREFRQRLHSHNRRELSLGSGVIVVPSGIVVTNEHVISRASKITVTLSDNRRYAGRLISSDPENDLAVLQIIDAPGQLPCIEMGISSDLMIGETVIALGNPFGLENSVSVGVLSATDRAVRAEGKVVLEHLIQIDAPINPGNSGGPLVNINGELIGINTAIVAGAQGIGFAMPVDRVKNVLAGLLDYRLVKGVWLGVRLQEITPDIAKQLAIPPGGVLVSEVEKGSPASAKDLRRKDVITAVDGEPVGHPFEFTRAVLRKDAGERIRIKYWRDRRTYTTTLKIEKMPQKSGMDLARVKLGLELQEISPEIARALDLDPGIGLIVTGVRPGSAAYDAGFQRKDLILRIAGSPVADVDRLAALLQQLRAGMRVQVLLYRSNALYRGMLTVQ